MNRLSLRMLVLLGLASPACSPVIIDEREVCGSGEVTVFAATPLVHFSAIALDATHVYWSGANEIMVAPKDGGPPAVFAENLPRVDWIAVDEINLYVHMLPDQGVPGIYSLGKAGNTSPKLLAETLMIFDAVLDLDRVYWSSPDLSFVPKAGGAPTALSQGYIGAFALNQERAYWIDDSTSEPALVSVPKLSPLPPGKLPHLAEVAKANTPVAADEEQVYYWTGADIVSLPNAGGEPRVLVPETEPVAWLFVEPECLFWTTSPLGYQHNKVRTARRGGEVVTAADGYALGTSVATDRSGVYWVDFAKDTIMKLSR